MYRDRDYAMQSLGVSVCGSALQSVVYVHCTHVRHCVIQALQYVAVCCIRAMYMYQTLCDTIIVCCSVLQCVVYVQCTHIRRCAIQALCVAVCCSVLQYVAVCCSVLYT